MMNSHNRKYFFSNESAHRVLQVQGGGGEGVLPVLRVPDNAADAVPCEQISRG